MTGTVIAFSWTGRAACARMDPAEVDDLFFGLDGESAEQRDVREAEAVKICRERCPVARQCLLFALQTGTTAGVFGGTGEQERANLARRMRRAAPAAELERATA